MKWYQIDIMLTAYDNMREIQKNIINFSGDVDYARKQQERILAAINKLSVSPKIYRVRKKDEFNRPLRYLSVDNYKYIVVYTIYEDERIVHVLNVFSGKRDIDSLI